MPKNWPKSSNYHNPVLLTEAVDCLNVQSGQKYIDATIGGGSHTLEIISRGGIVLGLDQDPDAIAACLALPDFAQALKSRNLLLVQTNFSHLAEVVAQKGWYPVLGILFDLGLSQHQIEVPSRGFSFQKKGPLDMRMGTSAITAAELVNLLSTDQLAQLLRDFGEIPVAKSIAARIVASRPFTDTLSLARVIGSKWTRQAFQALRIAVNDELGSLAITLPQAWSVLSAGGRLAIISFHSLEDRLVKNQFTTWQKKGEGKILTPKPVLGERQSKLRAIEKIK